MRHLCLGDNSVDERLYSFHVEEDRFFMHCEQNDGDAGHLRSYKFRRLNPTYNGHRKIENDQIRVAAHGNLNRFFTVGSFLAEFVSLFSFEDLAQSFADLSVVVRYQDCLNHASAPDLSNERQTSRKADAGTLCDRALSVFGGRVVVSTSLRNRFEVRLNRDPAT